MTHVTKLKGSVGDYANYFKNSKITEAAAEARGLLARGTGQAGFRIARDGSESLFALHQSGRLTDAQAQAIAEAAPGNEGPAAGRRVTRTARP